MNLNKNYYSTLGVKGDSDEKTIKKSYYKLSFTHHPDKNGDPVVFGEMTEAYDVLCSDLRKEYDLKSKFGNNYKRQKNIEIRVACLNLIGQFSCNDMIFWHS